MWIKTIITCDDCWKEIDFQWEIPSNIFCFNCSMKDKNNLSITTKLYNK